MEVQLRSTLIDRIEAQDSDERLQRLWGRMETCKGPDISVCAYSSHSLSEDRGEVLAEAHKSVYSIHPHSTKMYKDLKHFWW